MYNGPISTYLLKVLVILSKGHGIPLDAIYFSLPTRPCTLPFVRKGREGKKGRERGREEGNRESGGRGGRKERQTFLNFRTPLQLLSHFSAFITKSLKILVCNCCHFLITFPIHPLQTSILTNSEKQLFKFTSDFYSAELSDLPEACDTADHFIPILPSVDGTPQSDFPSNTQASPSESPGLSLLPLSKCWSFPKA